MPKAGSKRCSGCWKTGASDSPTWEHFGEFGISGISRGKLSRLSLDMFGKESLGVDMSSCFLLSLQDLLLH